MMKEQQKIPGSPPSRSAVPDASHFEIVSLLFKQLGDARRLRIFWILCHCEKCVTELAALMEMSPPAVSHHLRLLRGDRLIVSRREGKEVYYKAADSAQAQALHRATEAMIEISCPDTLCGGGER